MSIYPVNTWIVKLISRLRTAERCLCCAWLQATQYEIENYTMKPREWQRCERSQFGASICVHLVGLSQSLKTKLLCLISGKTIYPKRQGATEPVPQSAPPRTTDLHIGQRGSLTSDYRRERCRRDSNGMSQLCVPLDPKVRE